MSAPAPVTVPVRPFREPGLVTPGRLTEVLVAAGAAAPGDRVDAVTATPLGLGKLGHNVRYELAWAGGSGPASVVGKFPALDERSRHTGQGSDAYRREVAFYRELAGALPLPVPRCYAAGYDESSGDFVLLLGDAAPARPGDQLTGCTVDEVATVLTGLAAAQAVHWDRPAPGWLPVRGADGGRRLGAAYRLTAGAFAERFGDLLSPAALGVVEALRTRIRGWVRADRPPLTLLHGDLRVDNLLFTDGPEPAVTVVDWQTVQLGPGPSDAAYLVGGSLPTDVRRAREAELFASYHDALRAAGVRWSRDECWRSYRVNTVAGLHMTVVGAMLVARDGRGDAMFVAMAERHAAHVTDLDALTLLS
ncbi:MULTISPECIES: phosphotransferase [unclassified Micromonospora]|uniref:phosphotransferase family protein n=1 Tax=unclassified Micromonospora TaxID=2617518 RepID=UPI001C212256|nr:MULTISPECIES: phosphotransferase [unclassified Micromonospora]MBU8860485.1 ecdysteroid 22-kinase family protein [Micromonospora sp. WMMB482]MDM4780022.1 phosphotransferase [Micromonospora sp. b486]